jgi:hypothetical protein
LGNQFAAIGAWETQLTDRPTSPDAQVDLYEPADDRVDHGAHGRFNNQAGGFTDPAYLRTLPRTAATFGRATAMTVRDRLQRYRRTR